ncbi:hypothetical protein [Hyella patelloides]|uniref:hypothetical protein n=1 Tax=Hyella patelloides TaxID=1982969 RepID=UPI0011A2FF70|nr:hypothetical protein [Hyella patelloides]
MENYQQQQLKFSISLGETIPSDTLFKNSWSQILRQSASQYRGIVYQNEHKVTDFQSYNQLLAEAETILLVYDNRG